MPIHLDPCRAGRNLPKNPGQTAIRASAGSSANVNLRFGYRCVNSPRRRERTGFAPLRVAAYSAVTRTPACVLALSTAALALVVAALPSCGKPRSDRPNVLLVTIDTCRADRLGSYGFTLARTPNLDRLAREGVRCADASAVAPITLPSHASILTGLLPPAHGVRDNGTYALGAKAVTLAERLKAAGWATHALVSALVLNRRYGLDQGFDSYDDDLWSEDAPKLFLIRDRPARKTADKLLSWLDEWKEGGRTKPFFAWVHFFDPHQPYEPEAADRPLAPTPYDAEIAGVDRAIGRILDRLRQDSLLDDTIVVVTADHGESLGEHGEKTHAVFVYDATIRVPLFLRYPRLLPQGVVYEGAVSSVDLVPTLLAALGLPGGETTEGMNLLPALRGKAPSPPRSQYCESLLSEVGFGMAPLHALRRDGLKYIRAPRPELYDLKADPKELVNLFEKDRRRAALLDDALGSAMDASARRAVGADESPMSKETMETLRSLGYLAPAGVAKSLGGMDPKDGMPLYAKLEDARHAAQEKDWPGSRGETTVLAADVLPRPSVEAKAEYALSLTHDPKQSRVLSMLGTIDLLAQRSARRLDSSRRSNLGSSPGPHVGGRAAWYDRAAAADPGFPRGNKLSGDLWFERGDYRKALINYREVVRVPPDDFGRSCGHPPSARDPGRFFETRSSRFMEPVYTSPA